VFHTAKARKFTFERSDVFTEDEVSAGHGADDGVVEFRLELAVLNTEVDEMDFVCGHAAAEKDRIGEKITHERGGRSRKRRFPDCGLEDSGVCPVNRSSLWLLLHELSPLPASGHS
jgi:hypothetical protein